MQHYTDKAGTSLPQNCPALEPFIKAQAHIRAAARFIDEISVLQNPAFAKKQQESWKDLADDIRDSLWEIDSKVQDLMSSFLIPLFPIDNPVNK